MKCEGVNRKWSRLRQLFHAGQSFHCGSFASVALFMHKQWCGMQHLDATIKVAIRVRKVVVEYTQDFHYFPIMWLYWRSCWPNWTGTLQYAPAAFYVVSCRIIIQLAFFKCHNEKINICRMTNNMMSICIWNGAVFCLGFFCRARRPAPFSWRPALLKKPKWRPALLTKKINKKNKNISHTWLLALFCPFCCPHTAWIVLCIFYWAIQGHF